MGSSKTDGPRFHPDVLAGIALVLLCGVGFFLTTTFRDVPASLSQNVPPTFFPRLVLGVITLLSVALVLSGWRRPAVRLDAVPKSVYGTASLFIVAVALVPILGLRTTVFLFALALPFYWGERRPWRLVALAIGLPMAIHLIFAVLLGMRFPGGLLG